MKRMRKQPGPRFCLRFVWPFVLAAAGCAPYAPGRAEPTMATRAPVDKSALADAEPEHGEPTPAPATPERQAGDFAVYRFSGVQLEQPVTVMQRIVAQQGHILQMDVIVAAEGREPRELRVRLDERTGEVLSVARMENGVRRPFGVAAYEELMAATIPAVESNEMLLGATGVLVGVGKSELACTRTTYRVTSRGREAMMQTLESDTFPWGDVGGEIVADDGTVLYRAELVDFGGALDAAARERAIAAHEDESPYEDELE
jgi:hypothetical protein